MSIIGATILETAAGNASGKTVQLNVSVLKAQAKQLSAIKESYIALKNSINETLKTVDESWSTRLQSTFSSVMDEQLKNMADFEKQLDVGINAAVYAADQFSSTDASLAATLESSVAYGAEKLERDKRVAEKAAANATKAIYMYEHEEKYNADEFPDGTASEFWKVNYRPHCTWYAAARYEAVNGSDNPLRFTQQYDRDAANWPRLIDKNYFNCDEANVDTIKTNTIAVSTKPDHPANVNLMDNRIHRPIGASENHVAYVEAVKDGYVYYSQGSSNWNMSDAGYIYKMKVEDFAKDYNFIISAK